MTVWTTLILAFCRDMVLPLFVRLVAIGLYAMLIYMTFAVNKQNVQQAAGTSFKAIAALAMSKAAFEFLLPSVLLLVFFVIMKVGPGTNGASSANAKSLVE